LRFKEKRCDSSSSIFGQDSDRVEIEFAGLSLLQVCKARIVANFSVMTEHMYETSDGNKFVEATWMCVAAFEGGEVNIQSLTRGSIVHLTGRLRTNRYIDASGCEKVFTEVLANSLKVLG
jgi:single-stranded DNA-binding protein